MRRRLRAQRRAQLRNVRSRLHQASQRERPGRLRRDRCLRIRRGCVRRWLYALWHGGTRPGLRDPDRHDEQLRRVRSDLYRRHARLRRIGRLVFVRVGMSGEYTDALRRDVHGHGERREPLRDVRNRVHDAGAARDRDVREQRMHVCVQHGVHRLQRRVRRLLARQQQLRRLRHRMRRGHHLRGRLLRLQPEQRVQRVLQQRNDLRVVRQSVHLFLRKRRLVLRRVLRVGRDLRERLERRFVPVPRGTDRLQRRVRRHAERLEQLRWVRQDVRRRLLPWIVRGHDHRVPSADRQLWTFLDGVRA